MKRTGKIALTLVTAIAVIGIAGYALAGWGHGPGWGGRGGHMGYGPNNCPGWGFGYGPGADPDAYQAFEQQRSEFLKETEGLRQALYAKNLELRGELAKENPDVAKAAELQKEISDLEAQLDQKRLDFAIKNRGVAPGYGRGYGMGYGRGHHRGGPMMGYGPGACRR